MPATITIRNNGSIRIDSTHKSCGFESMIVARALPPPAPKPT